MSVKGQRNETCVVLGIIDFKKTWKFPTPGGGNIVVSALAPVVAGLKDINAGKMPVGNIMLVPSLKIVAAMDGTGDQKPTMLDAPG